MQLASNHITVIRCKDLPYVWKSYSCFSNKSHFICHLYLYKLNLCILLFSMCNLIIHIVSVLQSLFFTWKFSVLKIGVEQPDSMSMVAYIPYFHSKAVQFLCVVAFRHGRPTQQWWWWEHIWISSIPGFALRDWPHSELMFWLFADPHQGLEPAATLTSPGNTCSERTSRICCLFICTAAPFV